MVKLNGCHNKDTTRWTYPAQDGWIYSEDGTTRMPRVVQIKNVMSRNCVYSVLTRDDRCAGCIHNECASCSGCEYEIEVDVELVCNTMTRTHGAGCNAYKVKKK